MKTTYLFKSSGAWSPLWNLSEEKFFEIKSKNYEGNLFVKTFELQPYQEAFLKFLEEPCKLLLPQLSGKQAELWKNGFIASCENWKPQQVVFSEQHDPENFACSPISQISIETYTALYSRSCEIFGEGASEDKDMFLQAAIEGIPFVVLNKGNGVFEFRR